MDTLRRRITKRRLRAARVRLTLAFVIGLGMVGAPSAQAQTLTVLYNFKGSPDGDSPYAGFLVRDAASNLYGTTYGGGTVGYGTVFKVSKTGKETVLYSFCSESNCNDGTNPLAGLVRDPAGNLYGTTLYGGSGGTIGYGTVFKMSKDGKETVLHTFTGGITDGCYPAGGLLRDKAGSLYGTTQSCGSSNVGIVFKLSKTGKETVLHSFTGYDGANPTYTSLIMDTKGALYGVAQYGGTSNNGVVYKLSKTGTLTVLYNFAGGTMDGCYPYGTPAMDKNGNLYSTTWECGPSGYGIVWKLSKKHTETVLHSFAGYPSDGESPYAGVIMDAKGNLFGDTAAGGPSNTGTVYQLSKGGTLTLLHNFAEPEGMNPTGGLIWDTKGNLYGTALHGGDRDSGTVWKLTP